MRKRKWTDEQLIAAFHKHGSIRHILLELNLAVAGGSYINIKKHLKRLGLEFDTSWQERRDNAVNKHRYTNVYTDEEVFSENSKCNFGAIRARFEKINPQQCSKCDCIDWMGTPLILDLDHINGNRNDHRIENLRWLCPNCHRQTKTWGQTKRTMPV
jgi:hypothetical protein